MHVAGLSQLASCFRKGQAHAYRTGMLTALSDVAGDRGNVWKVMLMRKAQERHTRDDVFRFLFGP
jgi:hypothetical protein